MPPHDTPLHAAANAVTAELLLEHGADLEASGREKHTPMLRAIIDGRSDVVRMLVSYGANMSAHDRMGHVATNKVVEHGDPGLVRLFFSRFGIDPTDPDWA